MNSNTKTKTKTNNNSNKQTPNTHFKPITFDTTSSYPISSYPALSPPFLPAFGFTGSKRQLRTQPINRIARPPNLSTFEPTNLTTFEPTNLTTLLNQAYCETAPLLHPTVLLIHRNPLDPQPPQTLPTSNLLSHSIETQSLTANIPW